MIIEYFIEVPGTNIKEPVEGFAYDLLYDMAQQAWAQNKRRACAKRA